MSRGVCKVKDGKLDTIQEALKVQLYPDGHLTDLDTDTDLAPDTVVSMNFWGFMPSIFPALRTYFENFLRGLPDDAMKAECLLPLMVGEELKAGRMTVSVLHSKDLWFGDLPRGPGPCGRGPAATSRVRRLSALSAGLNRRIRIGPEAGRRSRFRADVFIVKNLSPNCY